MLHTGGGVIVNHSSVNGLKGNPNGALYIASKHAVVGMTRAAALDYAEKGIRINAVAPGPIETPMLERMGEGNPQSFARFAPMRRLGKPEEVARAVVWLLSDEASYVTGHIISVDGGICAR